jgi:hypothetical protein
MTTTNTAKQEQFATVTNLFLKGEIDYSLYVGLQTMVGSPIFEEQLHKLKAGN